MANVLLAAGLVVPLEKRLQRLLQEDTPDADALAKELRPKALTFAFETGASINATVLSQIEDVIRRKVDVPEAHLILMRCYQDGIIVEKNRATSSFHLTQAARKGNHAARYLIAANDVKQSDPTIRYQALATLIELALNGDYWKIRENALWRAVRILYSTVELNTQSPDDAQFVEFYEATFKGEDPGLLALLKDAGASLMAANAKIGLNEDGQAAEAAKSEVEEWRQRSRTFLVRHHDRIKALGNPEKEGIPPVPAHLKQPASTSRDQEIEVLKASSALRTQVREEPGAKTEQFNIPLRTLISIACILLGFFFFPLFFVGGFIAWSIYRDIVEAPTRQREKAEIEARVNAPVSVDEIRRSCESPAETAFFDAMVSAYNLQTGPGAIEGQGLRLRNQVSMGRLRIYSNYASSQYRADFLVDEKLVVEIDGATYHSSPEAVARDRQRDADMRREGYSILRIPAQVVFRDSAEAVKRVENARKKLRNGGSSAGVPSAAAG